MSEQNEKEATGDRSFTEMASQPQPGLLRDFWHFLRYNKKWWITPIVIVLLLVAALVLLSGSPIAPFIYTLS